MSRRSSSGFWYDDVNTPNITDRARYKEIINAFNSQQLEISQLTNEELIKLDRAYAKSRRFDEAIPCHLAVLKRANCKEANHRSKEGDAHENLAYAYHKTRQFEDSKHHYNEALKINEIYRDNLVYQRIYKRLGKLHQQLEEYDSAIDCFKKLLLISQTIKDPLYTRDAYEALADVYQRQKSYVEAIDFHKKHRKQLKEFRRRFQINSWHKWYNDVTKQLGDCYRQDDNNKNALRQYQKYYKLISRVDSCPTSELAHTMTIIARLHVAIGNYKDACKCYEEIIRCYKQDEDDEVSEMVVDAMVSLADLELQQKDFDNAYQHYSDAFNQAKSLKMELKQSQICCKQGIVYLNKGSHLEALGKFNEALQVLQITKSLPAEQKENQMSVVHTHLRLLQEDQEIDNECYRRDDKLLVYDKMAKQYLKSNLKAKALECYEKSLQILQQYRNTNKERIGHTYERIAYICQQQRNYTRAEENYLEARAIAKDVQDWKLCVHLTLQLGELCKRQEQFEKATAHYEDANTTANRRVNFLLLQTHAATGKFYVASVQYDKAEVKFLKQLEEARKREDGYMEVDAFLSLASLSFKQEETQKGIDYLRQVKLENIKNFDLRRRLGEAYRSLADSYQPHNQQLKQKALDKAIENFEKAHQVWEEQTNIRPQTGYERNLKNSQELTRIYIQKGDTKRALYHRLKSGESMLKDELIRRDANCSQIDAFDLIEVLKNAPFGVLVYSFHKEKSMHVWSFQGNGGEPKISTQIASVSQVQGLIEECWKNGQKKKKVNSLLKKLYEILIVPIKGPLTKEELVIDADGPLHNVPFAALRDSSGKYLFEYKRVRIAPSLQSLKLIMERPKDYHNVNGALVIAASYVKDMEPLQSADKEAKSIAELFGVKPLIGKLASKQNVLKVMKKEMPAIIHIAAHGSQGKIYLASTQTTGCKSTPSEKDHLTMDDVRAIEVKAQLVVLSCCFSGKGDVTNAGEVLAMSRAFIAAGARAVIATLWNIDDEMSPVFMMELYNGLKRNRESIGISLQNAMKYVNSENRSHPNYWAPFVHIGDDFIIDPSTFPAEEKPPMHAKASHQPWNHSKKVRR